MSLLADVAFWTLVLAFAGAFAVFTLGLQIQVGAGGLSNFGHVAFLAIGGYTMGLLALRLQLPMAVTIPAAILVSVLAGLVISLPTLRLRGAYFAIATIAFGEIVRIFILNEQDLTGGPRGLIGYEREWGAVKRGLLELLRGLGWRNPDPSAPLALVAWAIAILLAVALWRLNHSPWGRIMRAIREDEEAAEALGKPVLGYKLQAIAFGAAIGGLGGVLYAYNLAVLTPNFFDPSLTFLAYTMLILGGAGSPLGTLLGVLIMSVIYAGSTFLDLPLQPQQVSALRQMLVGLILMLLIAFRPQGILGNRQEMLFE